MPMDNRAFDFLRVNDRPDKPRETGITEIQGPYYDPMGPRELRDILETMGHYVDIYKFSGGSFALMPEDAVETLPSDTENLPRIPMVQYECERCGDTTTSDLGTAFLDHPDVVAFYHDHDIDVRETSLWRFIAVDEDSVRVLEEEPLRASVTYTADGDRLTFTVDEGLDVLAIERD